LAQELIGLSPNKVLSVLHYPYIRASVCCYDQVVGRVYVVLVVPRCA